MPSADFTINGNINLKPSTVKISSGETAFWSFSSSASFPPVMPSLVVAIFDTSMQSPPSGRLVWVVTSLLFVG